MTTVPMNPLDLALVHEIQRGYNPLNNGWEYYIPALVAGIHEDDQRFYLYRPYVSCATYDELEEFVVRRLCKDISGRCVVLETESGSYTVPAFKAWLAADPKLDARVARIITLGLRPWEDQAEREFQHQLKEARKVFRRMTSNVRYSTSG